MDPNQMASAPPPSYEAATNPQFQQQPPVINQEPSVAQPEERIIASFFIDFDQGHCNYKAPRVKEPQFFPINVTNLGSEVEESIKTLIESINEEFNSRNAPSGVLTTVFVGGPICLMFGSHYFCPVTSTAGDIGLFLLPLGGMAGVAGIKNYCHSKLKTGLESVLSEWNSQHSFMGVYLRWNNSMTQYFAYNGSKTALLKMAMASSGGQQPGLEVVMHMPTHMRYCQEKGVVFTQPQ